MSHFLVLLFFSLYLTATVHSALVTVAENLPTPLDTSRFSDGFGNASPSGSIYDNSAGQTFTALQAGGLFQIKATVSLRSGITTAPIKISVMDVINGIPTNLLTSALIPVANVPTELSSLWQGNSFTVAATFDESLNLTAGNEYAILFTTEGEGGANYGIWGLSGDSEEYVGGVRFGANNATQFTMYPTQQGDYFFQVIASVPEPGSLYLAAGGMICLLANRRRVIG